MSRYCPKIGATCYAEECVAFERRYHSRRFYDAVKQHKELAWSFFGKKEKCMGEKDYHVCLKQIFETPYCKLLKFSIGKTELVKEEKLDEWDTWFISPAPVLCPLTSKVNLNEKD